MKKQLPRLLYLPYELGIFAAQRPCTCYELYAETVRLAGEALCNINEEHIALVKDWCIGAAYKGTGNASIFALTTSDVTSDTEAFVKFRQKKCNWFLGESSPKPTEMQATNNL